MHLLERRPHRGFAVVNTADGKDWEPLIRALDNALDLIEHFDPKRMAQMRRYVRRIVFVPGGGDHYSTALQAIMADAPCLKMRTNTLSALVLVHEAMHARLDVRGISHSRMNAERIEKLCVKEQVAFARKLPGGAALVDQLYRTLEQRWWEEPHATERVLRRLEASGMPSWLVKLMALPERLTRR